MARWRRKLKRVVIGLVGLVVVVAGLALLALANLDVRPMKSWVRSAARSRGIALDYDAGRVTLGGVRFAGVRIASPARDAAIAPDLLAIGAIEGRWSPLSKRVDELVIRDVALTIVRDPDGTTSLDRWLAEMPRSPSSPPASTAPSDPLSRVGSALLPIGVEAHARIERVTVTVIDRAGGGPARKLTLTGLTARADVDTGGLALAVGPGPLRLTVEGGTPEAAPSPRELVVDLRTEARLASGGHARIRLDVAMVRQTLAPELAPLKEIASLAASIDFDAPGRKTVVRLERLRLLDGAASLSADVRAEDVITAGEPGLRPVVEQLALKVDLPAIARALPAELGPLDVEGEPLVVTVKNAALVPAPQGALTASGALARARWRDIALRELTLGVDGKPVGKGGAQGELRIAVGELTMPGLAVRRIDATVSGEHPADAGAASPASPAMWPIAGTARATIGAIETPAQRLGDVSVVARATVKSASVLDGELTLDVGKVDAGAAVDGLHVEVAARDVVLAAQPLASTGSLRAQGTVAALRSPGGPRARRVAFTAGAALAGTAPVRATIALDAAELVVPGLAAQLGPAFAGGPVHAEIAVPALELAIADPARSRGSAALTARYGGATVEGTASGSLDEVTYTMKARAPRLGPAREVVVGSRGTVRAADRWISHDTDLQVGPTALANAAVRGARIHLVSSGTPVQHQGKIALAVDALSSGGRTFPSARLDVTASADLSRGALDVRLQGAAPAADVHLTALIDPVRRVHWQVKGRLAGLAAASAVLPPGPDWSRLAVEIDGRGVASGIVARVVGGVPELVADPASSLRGHQALTVTVRDAHYADAALNRADVDAATLKAEVDLSATRTAMVALDVPALAAISQGVKLGARALAVRLDATLGGHGVNAKLSVKAKSATQSAVPWYGIEDPAIEVTVAGDPDATLAIAMHVANPGGATAFDLQGDLERGHTSPAAGVVARNSLALEGVLVQGLDRLAAAPGTLAARGQIKVPLRIESGDLTLFRTSARIGLDHVAVDLPAAKVRLTDINGELPVVQEIVIGPEGVQRVGQGEHGPFSQLRFPDYRPFAGDLDYLSIGGIDVNGMAFGPVAGNARIDHDIAALDQLELNALDGKITGQLLAELRGLDTRLVFRGKLTGLRAPAPGKTGADGREPLDANLAIALTPYRYGLEGRAELVRIGRDHLRALLDVWDPYRADVAVNRVRLALLAGYPKQVRLQFASGFAALAIELGGLAGLVRIDELRGLPIGPALARYLAPVLEP